MLRIVCAAVGLWLFAACVQADEDISPMPIRREAAKSTDTARDAIHRRAAREAMERRARIQQRKLGERAAVTYSTRPRFMYPNWYIYQPVRDVPFPWWQR
jgi:hypothetical protein